MARIAGVDIPPQKRVGVSLTYIHGIGDTTAQKILKMANIDPEKRTKDLPEEEVGRTRRRERKNVVAGQAHIQSTFNNTIISISDIDGNVIAWGSAGAQGFKGSRKSTPFAAQQTAEATAKRALEHGMRSIEVFVR